MRMAELVERSGIPLATIKYYLREGLLMAGESHGATSATYGDEHLARLRLIRALIDVVGLPVQKAREVLRLIDEPPADPYVALGRAVAALPPHLEPSPSAEYPRARRVLEQLGQVFDPKFPAVAQLDRALEACETAGLPLSPERAELYGRHLLAIAEAEQSSMPTGTPEQAISYAVLGISLHEPVLAAMRRLAHQQLAHQRFRTKGRSHRR